MKLGCLFAFLSFCALTAIGVCVGLIVDMLPGVQANYEGLGSIVGTLFFFLVGPMAFVYGFRRQARHDKEKEIENRKPENLRPTNLSGVVKSRSPDRDIRE